jgi:hypothetical protein
MNAARVLAFEFGATIPSWLPGVAKVTLIEVTNKLVWHAIRVFGASNISRITRGMEDDLFCALDGFHNPAPSRSECSCECQYRFFCLGMLERAGTQFPSFGIET